MAPDLISFDLDHTLIDFDRVLDEALTAVATWMREEIGLDTTPAGLQADRNRAAERPENQGLPLLGLRRAGFAESLGPRHETWADTALALFKTARFRRAHLLPDARATLEVLGEIAPLAALSNGNSDPDRAGLGGHFAHVHLEGHAGYVKPDPRAFQALFHAAGARPAYCLHVGDSFTDDVRGAVGAGARAIWFNPGAALPPDSTPHLSVQRLAELPALISRHL